MAISQAWMQIKAMFIALRLQEILPSVAKPAALLLWTLILQFLITLPELLCSLGGAVTHNDDFGISIVVGSTLFHLLVGLGELLVTVNS